MESIQSASDVLFILIGAIMVLAMHAGFAFLEVGTVRSKNQVNALVKIMVDFLCLLLLIFLLAIVSRMGLAFSAVRRLLLLKMVTIWSSSFSY